MSISLNFTQPKQQRLMRILLKPHLSEKGSLISEKSKQFIFEVTSDANKQEVKQAVEMLFNVHVNSVQICNAKSKTKRFKQILGRRKAWKKAYVTLKEGFDIDFTGTK